MRHKHLKQESNNASDLPNFQRAILLSMPMESDGGLDMITRWISIADQALGNSHSPQKATGRKTRAQ
jgi:hypothetical protein